jgi:hypothetical protein
VQDEGEDPVQLVHAVGAVGRVQRQDDLAVRARGEGEAGVGDAQGAVVVDLAVDGQGHRLVLGEEGLLAADGIDDGEALMSQHRTARLMQARPVRAAVPQLAALVQDQAAQALPLGRSDDCDDPAHADLLRCRQR